MIKQLEKWHKTKLGLFIFSLVELALAYGFASLAIDRGNLLYYLLAIVFLFGTLKNLTTLIGRLRNVRKAR